MTFIPKEPGVYYLNAPEQCRPPPLPTAHLDARSVRMQRRADVRTRRAVLLAWTEPATAREDIAAASEVYAVLNDMHGMANACIANADLRRGSSHLAARAAPVLPFPTMAVAYARQEYLNAVSLFSRLSDAYDIERQRPMHAAMKAARRPRPITLGPEDAIAAESGGDECMWQAPGRWR
uniref:Uncharacterized protein n=1 Tax=Calcidiscus leptoporus TaxID=127549 RepID=A0A7S0NXT0_9EUKA|mmetsp:Transcript_37688/g.88158  ORF Transcript_37688/g.88158 Transcript_37688/m.88158 type:complete len:179 (+) Transcript_37688:29-565(+)